MVFPNLMHFWETENDISTSAALMLKRLKLFIHESDHAGINGLRVKAV